MARFTTMRRTMKPIEWVIVAVILGLLVSYGVQVWLLRGQAHQNAVTKKAAVAGQQAHTRQCAVLPVGIKLYMAALARGDINQHDYDLITRSVAALGCSAKQNASAVAAGR